MSQDRIVVKRIAITLFKYLLAVSVLTWVVWSNWDPPPNGKGGLGYVWDHHVLTGGAGVHWDYLFYGFALFEIGVSLTLVRWYLLVRCQGLPLTLGNAFRIGMIGCFFNLVMPGSVGGDVMKALALAREQSRRTVAVATVLMDRIIGLWGLFWLVGILGGIFWLTGQLEGPGGEQSKLVIEITAGILAASLAIWFPLGLLSNERAENIARKLTRLPKVGGPVAELWRAVWIYRCQQVTVLWAILISWLGFGIFVMAFYFCAYTLWSPEMGPLPTIQQHYILVPIGLLIRSIPGFPGGAGIGEYGFGVLYVWYMGEGAMASGVLGSLMQRLVEVATGMIGFVVYMVVPSAKVPAATPSPAFAAPQLVAVPEETAAQIWLPAKAEGSTAS
jgi:uncharacterized protein (TIRG00374 family)